jgi:hypothetical protein
LITVSKKNLTKTSKKNKLNIYLKLNTNQFDVNAPIVFGVLFNYKISNLLFLYEEVAVTVKIYTQKSLKSIIVSSSFINDDPKSKRTFCSRVYFFISGSDSLIFFLDIFII